MTVEMADNGHTDGEHGPFSGELNRHFLIGLARAFGGAVIFALPMMMTMEMWELGFYMGRVKLLLLVVVTLPLLVGLSHYIGFEPTFELKEDLVDALVAVAVGALTSLVILLLLSVIEPPMSPGEIVGKLALQTVPAAIGALLAQAQLGQKEDEQEKQRDIGYFGVLFLMAVGGLFLALNLAPTEEMFLIAYRMTPVHGLLLAGASLLLMHAFVYAVDFSGEVELPEDVPLWQVFLRYTVVGYAQALLISAFVLWLFGRTDGIAFAEVLMITVVLGFPAAVGAAAARLIL